jgi:hypothetical protein
MVRLAWFTVLTVVVVCPRLFAHQVEEVLSQQLPAERLAVMKAAASEYSLAVGERGERKVVLREEPVFRWSNPVQGSKDGAVFLWTEAGLPRAIVGIYPNPDAGGGWHHEWQSLAIEPLTAERGNATVWHPQVAGINWQALPMDEAPATSAPRRLTQMKALARRFTGSFLPWVKKDENDWIELRLLPQPLYRAELDGQGEVIDSGLFGFVQGTDPQMLLLLEARRGDKGLEWRYALARLASGGLRGKLDERVVWEQEKYNFKPDPAAAYILLTVR